MGKGDLPAQDGPFGFGSVGLGASYGVELLYPQSPPLDAEVLASRVKQFCPQADAADAGGKPPILFSHKDHLIPLDVATPEGTAAVPARTVVLPTDALADVASLHESLHQTRDWDDAAIALARSQNRVVVTDLLARELDPRQRLELFEKVLLGIIEAARPAAIHWKPAGKLVDPAALLKASGSAEVDALPAAAINVRLFRVKNSDADLLMDTLGLAALGLADYQVVFHGMEPSRVAAHLYAVALYALRNGEFVEDGDAIEGPTRGTEWTARHARAAVAPARPVVDFDPGPDHAVRAA
jgi:hypothetical protein